MTPEQGMSQDASSRHTSQKFARARETQARWPLGLVATLSQVRASGVGVFDTLKAMAKLVLMERKKGADDADKAPAKPRKLRSKAAPAGAAPAKAAR